MNTFVTQPEFILRVTMGVLLGLASGQWVERVAAEEAETPKSMHKTCGKCPDGFATTGVTTAPEICKGDDPTLVQCVPVGANMLPACGSCPPGYVEIGSSSVPARCGNQDGGRLSQCQLQKMEMNLPDPTQGGKICPPDCGSTPKPGQGALPPPPKFLPPPESK
ncbi:MAG TPA: hypothetical protein VH681_02045 [Nitrospiraceae bacterium]|jgi:hypothetical protein